MAYTGFDPRDDLISSFASDADYNRDGIDEKCVQPTNDHGSTVNVPVLCVEESRVGDLPYLPLVEVTMVSPPSHLTNLGRTRYNDSIVDFNIYVQKKDYVTVKTFMQAIVNIIVNGITTTNQSGSFPNFLHAEIINDGRIIVEKVGDGIVFHRIVSVRANRYDSG